MTTPTVVQQAHIDSSSTVSFGSNTTPGNRLIAISAICQFGGGVATWTPPSGFTQIDAGEQTAGFGNVSCGIFEAKNITGGTKTYTFTPSTTGNGQDIAIIEISGDGPTDAHDSFVVSVFPAASTASVTLSLTGASDLLIGLIMYHSNAAPSLGTGCANLDGASNINNCGTYTETRSSSGTSDNVINCTGLGGNDTIFAGIAIKAAGGGGGGITVNIPIPTLHGIVSIPNVR